MDTRPDYDFIRRPKNPGKYSNEIPLPPKGMRWKHDTFTWEKEDGTKVTEPTVQLEPIPWSYTQFFSQAARSLFCCCCAPNEPPEPREGTPLLKKKLD